MTLGSTIKQNMTSFAKALGISSANEAHTNRVKWIDYFSESGDYDASLQADVIKIIQDEIKIQLTKAADPGQRKDKPSGSVEAQAISGVKKGIGFAQNPTSIATNMLKFLPHTALVALALSLAPMILEQITKPGGPMDVRWKRIMAEEQNAFLDRQTQRNTQIGTRQLIVKTRSGFTAINPALNYNNLRDIRDGGANKDRLSQIDITDHTKGLFN